MALTRDFKLAVKDRAEQDKDFRKALFIEALNALLDDELVVAKSLLRDYINATVSFSSLGEIVDKNSKSLHRMFSAKGNPTAKSLFSVIHAIQESEGIKLMVSEAH